MPMPDYFWVIGGGLLQIPLVAEVRYQGLRVIVTDYDDHCPCQPQADLFRAVDVFDIPGHITLANEILDQGDRVVGVLAAGIDAPETMASLSSHLGLPGVDREIARKVNNKAEFRAAMSALGEPVPQYWPITPDKHNDIDQILAKVTCPFIVKNTDSSGSRGTKIFQSKEDLKEIRRMVALAMAVSRSNTAIIESCWEGTEHTVETLFDSQGHFHRCFITDRHFDKSQGYAIETGLIHPTTVNPAQADEMYVMAERVARKLGITIGAAKFDMMMTDRGPRILEMTVRLSGGFDCQYLVPAATGKNVLGAAVRTAMGQPFPNDWLIDHIGRIGATGSIWPKPGKIQAIKGLDVAQALPGVEHIFFRYQVGDTVEAFTDCTKRVCFIIVTGADADEAQRNLARAQDCIRIEQE